MRICDIEDFVEGENNAVFINALLQLWQTKREFSCLGAPKQQNLFLLVNRCKITYTEKDGRVVTAESGDVVYTPIGSEYKAEFTDFRDGESNTVGINFLLFDELGEPMVFSDRIILFKQSTDALNILFRRSLSYDAIRPRYKNKILLMEILVELSGKSENRRIPAYVSEAAKYMAEHIEENPSISRLASMCNVSEVYFRRSFKKYMGTTPHEYRNELRLKRARTYLEYGDISIQEISDLLGYATVSHFIKEFKRKNGCSPLKYRKQIYTC